MFTVKEAAEALGVSTALVYGLCARGKILHERYGLGRGTIRIPDESLAEFRSRSQAGRAPVINPAPPVPRLKHITLSPSGPARAGRSGTATGAGRSSRA